MVQMKKKNATNQYFKIEVKNKKEKKICRDEEIYCAGESDGEVKEEVGRLIS